MKINQFGTVAVIGVVLSITAACGGSPTKASAVIPSLGDGASAASVNLTSPKAVAATDQVCTGQPQTFVEGESGNGEIPNADAPPVTCTSTASSEAPSDVVVSDTPSMDASTSLARRLHR